MIALDTNILVYAHRPELPFHDTAVQLLTQVAEGTSTWAIPWPCVHEFLAVVTNRKFFKPPTPLDKALEFMAALIKSPSLLLLGEAEGHWVALRSLTMKGRITGGRIHDARIAAICLQHGVRELWSADRDFNRFPELRVVNPLLRQGLRQ